MKEQNTNLNLKQIKEALQANAICKADHLNQSLHGVYASDLMSDVLAYGEAGSILLTGLCTNQAIVSAYMADFKAIVFLRGKTPNLDIIQFGEEKGICILVTKADMFEACVKIARIYTDLLPCDKVIKTTKTNMKDSSKHVFNIDGKDFANSGFVSSQIKTTLKNIGYAPQLIRSISICIYEAEMNVVMHADSAEVIMTTGNEEISIIIEDKGKGIPDVDLAMQQGFSTATDDQRALGFGAGMGLPNMEKNADTLNVISVVGKGTRIEMRFFVK